VIFRKAIERGNLVVAEVSALEIGRPLLVSRHEPKQRRNVD
jgi:hypothetical protein